MIDEKEEIWRYRQFSKIEEVLEENKGGIVRDLPYIR